MLVAARLTGLGVVCALDTAAAVALGLSAEDARRVGTLVPWVPVSQEAITINHCAGGGTGQHGTAGGGWGTLVGGAELDLSAGAVYWKATVVEKGSYVYLGAIGNARPEANSYSDPTAFGWSSYGGYVCIAGKVTTPSTLRGTKQTCHTMTSSTPPAEFIISNAKFLVLNAQFLVFNTKFLVCSAQPASTEYDQSTLSFFLLQNHHFYCKRSFFIAK